MMEEGLARADRDYTFTFVNDAFARMLGYTPEEMVGRKLIEFIHEDARAAMADQMAKRAKGESARYELVWRSRDGAKVYTQVSPRPVFDEDGDFIGSIAVLTDITDRKQAEQALQDSEARYRILFHSNPLPMWVYDLETLRFLQVNDAAIAHYGYSEAEFLSMTIKDIRPPEDIPALMQNVSEVTEGLDRAGVWRHVRKDGSIIYVEITSHTLTWAGRRAEVVLAHDVTDRIRGEEALKASEANYREIFNAVNDTIFVHDVNTGEVLDANRKATEMYGYTLEELKAASIEDISPGKPPYTQEDALRWVRKAAEDGPQLFEWKGKHKSGRVHWEEVNLKRAVIGGKERLLAMVRDISERKKAESQIKAEQKLRMEFYRRTILAATEGKLAIGEKGDIERIEGTLLASWDVTGAEVQSEVRHEASEIAEREEMEKSRVCDFEVCIGEATTNAIKHAGSGRASLHRQRDGLLFVISDEGPGIEALSLPDVALTRGFSTAGTLGMGYKLMIACADRIYLVTGPGGTTVAVEMKLRKPSEPMQGPFPSLANHGLQSGV